MLKRVSKDTLHDFAKIKMDNVDGTDPIALFIDDLVKPIAIIIDQSDLDESTCYQTIGQHSEIRSYYAITLQSVDPYNQKHMEDCAELILELIRIGYAPKIFHTTSLFNSLEYWDRFIAEGKKLIT